MNTVVIDAGLLLAALFPDPKSAAAAEILDRHLAGEMELAAPRFIFLECLNASLIALRRQRITEQAYQRLIKFISGLEIEIMDASMNAVSELASKHQLSAFEAAYLAIAVQKQCGFATLDERLKQAACAEGLPEGIVCK